MPFPSQALDDEMVPGPQEDARDPRGLEPVQERLIVRDHDCPMPRREVEERIVRGPVALDRAVVPCEPLRRACRAVSLSQDAQLREDRGGDRDVHLPQDPAELRVQMEAELEWHHEGVRVEEDEQRHRFRASVPEYIALR